MHIAITKIHTQKGIAERFVNDIRKSVKSIMEQPDRKLGKTVILNTFKIGNIYILNLYLINHKRRLCTVALLAFQTRV